MTVEARPTDPLYGALVHVDDAMNEVGSLTISYSGAYCGLQDAIRGFGNLEDARYRFAMEATLLSSAHDTWKQAVAALNTQVEDGVTWQAWFMGPRKRCANCGDAETWDNRWTHQGTCNECVATAHPDGLLEMVEVTHAVITSDGDVAVTDHWAGYPGTISERSWRPE